MSEAKNLGHLVFVYGTLKRGEPNHVFLDDPANGKKQFLTRGHTVEAFPLVVATEYGVPFLLDRPGLGHQVQGEVYEVDEEMFNYLDKFEDVPSFYKRRQVEVKTDNDGSTIKCWLYALPDFKEQILSSKFLKNYSASDEGNIRFVPRSERTSKNFYWEIKQNSQQK